MTPGYRTIPRYELGNKKMKFLHVLVDDERKFFMDHTFRTAEYARTRLWQLGDEITHLYMDHDLGHKFGNDYDNGYKILTDFLEAGFRPIEVFLVTANPVGKQNMAAALLNHGYIKVTPYKFYREYIPSL